MSKTVTVSKSNVALAIGVLGVLGLIGSQTYAAEPASKRKAGPSTSTQTTSVRSMNASHRLNRAPATPAAWKRIGGLKSETEVVENARRPGSFTAAPSQPTAYEGKPVANYNFVNAWPSKGPRPQPGAYQIISAGEDAQSAANGRRRNEIHIESLTWSQSNATPSAETLDIAHAGFVEATKNEVATESITIVSERMQRE